MYTVLFMYKYLLLSSPAKSNNLVDLSKRKKNPYIISLLNKNYNPQTNLSSQIIKYYLLFMPMRILVYYN